MNELASAETTGDAAVFDHDTVDDYTIINSQGYRTTKQALLKAVRDGSYKVESKDVEILEVRSYGEAAVVVGVSTMKGKWRMPTSVEPACSPGSGCGEVIAGKRKPFNRLAPPKTGTNLQ